MYLAHTFLLKILTFNITFCNILHTDNQTGCQNSKPSLCCVANRVFYISKVVYDKMIYLVTRRYFWAVRVYYKTWLAAKVWYKLYGRFESWRPFLLHTDPDISSLYIRRTRQEDACYCSPSLIMASVHTSTTTKMFACHQHACITRMLGRWGLHVRKCFKQFAFEGAAR